MSQPQEVNRASSHMSQSQDVDRPGFRFATEDDAQLVLDFIQALAEYEKMADQVVATPELLKEWLFEKRMAEVLFVLAPTQDIQGEGVSELRSASDSCRAPDSRGAAGSNPPYRSGLSEAGDGLSYSEVGFALFFHNFSTFLGRPGIYLEDLFVKPEYRGQGYGKALLARLAALAVERGCGRLEWSCLDWNQPSIDFYRSLGAQPLDDWTTFRLTGSALSECANFAS